MSDWAGVRLGELASFRKGVKVEVFDQERRDTAPYLGASSLEGKKSTQWASTRGAVVADESNVLMLWDGERSGLVGGGLSGVVASTVACLSPKPGVDAGFLKHALQAKFKWIQARRTGTGVPHVPKDLARWLILDRPTSLQEQRRIAKLLGTFDDQLRNSQAIVEKLRLARTGLVNDLLSEGRWGRDNLPRGWLHGPIAEWCDRMTVGVVNNATHAYVEEGVPFIRSQNVKPGHIDTSGMLYITKAYNALQSGSILRAGDVVVVRTGYPGTAAVVPDELAGANCFSLLVASPRASVLSPDYLALYLNSDRCKAAIGRLHFGSAQHNLNLAELKRLPITLPTLPEQDAIVTGVRSMDAVIAQEQSALRKLHLLKDGTAADLLSGRVRLAQETVS